MRSILKHLYLLLFSCVIFSQEYIYKEFGLNEGLPSTQVYNMHQDRNGIIWFATDRGIANYNGYEFKRFGVKDGLPNYVVLDLYPQKNGVIYCATLDNQLYYFNENFNGIQPYKYNHILAKHIYHSHFINSMYFDQNESLHIGCDSRIGELIIDKNGIVREGKKSLSVDPYKKNFLVYRELKDESSFYYLLEESTEVQNKFNKYPLKDEGSYDNISIENFKKSNRTIIKDFIGLTLFDENKKEIKRIENNYRPISLKAIDNTYMFVGYLFNGGAFIDKNGTVVKHFLKNESITDFMIDKEGGYWFSTLFSGVFYIKEPKIKVFNESKTDSPIYTLTKDELNQLFVGYDNGKIIKIDTSNKINTYFDSNNKSKSYLEYNSDLKFNYFYSNGSFINNTTLEKLGKIRNYVIKLSEPTSKGILLSHINSIMLIDIEGNKTTKIKLPFRALDACYFKDAIYIASQKGIHIYQNNKLTHLSIKNKLLGYRFNDIDYNEKRNTLYFGSLGQGLIVYDKNKENIYSISTKNGLLSDIVNEIHIENENEIWICTNAGLNKVSFTKNGKYIVTGLKSSNGLLNDGVTDVEIINNQVWVASKKGLVKVPKSMFDNNKKNHTDAFLRIKQVVVNDKEMKIASVNDLSYDQNRIEINFETVSFKNEGNIVYLYKLEGLDDKWYSTTNRKVVYSSLPYGEYTFQLKIEDVLNQNNRKIIELPINIKAPFWKRTWFVILLLLALSGATYFVFKFRVLSYNKNITRELIRLLIKKMKKRENYFVFKESGKQIRVKTDTILYVKSSGNYIELITENKSYVVRCKIGDFIKLTPDPLEYIRIHRSYIVRIDKVESKSKTELIVKGQKLPVSLGYESEIEKLIF